MSYQAAHCRLCADLKPNSKLVNLQANEDTKVKVLEKLSRLSVYVPNLGSTDDYLPKTICFLCNDSLDKAFDFVIRVETAQSEFSDLVSSHIKQEDFVDFNEDSDELKGASEVKVEDGATFASELTVDDSNSNTKNLEKCQALLKHHDGRLDELPLSQLKLSWQDYSWKCAYCDTLFLNIGELKSHSIEYHSCCNAYRCIDCNIRVFNLDRFITHVRRHRKYLKLSCYLCHMKFLKLYDAVAHKHSHSNSKYRCSGCNELFASVEDLVQHSTVYNKDRKNRDVPKEHLTDNLICEICNKTYNSKGTLSQHLLTHTNRKRDHTCEICGKCFLNKYNLADHLNMHGDAKPHQCEICKRCFRKRTQLRAHIGVHNVEKPFACEKCGRRFRLQRQLVSHGIVHTDLFPYVCNICHKRFRFKGQLTQHDRQHTGVKPYSCQICQRNFTNWPNYSKHMRRQHGVEVARRKLTTEPQTKKNLEWMKMVLEERKHSVECRVKSKNSKTNLVSDGEVEN